jgi:hypothetical protein
LLGTSAGIPELEDLSIGNPDRLSHIQVVVDWFGPNDVFMMDEQLIQCKLTLQADQTQTSRIHLNLQYLEIRFRKFLRKLKLPILIQIFALAHHPFLSSMM